MNEAVAIIGLSCRFPGAPDRESFWNLLDAGRDAISEVPASRWNIDEFHDPDMSRPGAMNIRTGGFLDGIEDFDATLFGMSPREAASTDPQHRLLLEAAWECLEDAGLPPRGLAGSRTGVFVGISSTDYSRVAFAEPERVNAYYAIGNTSCIAANRISSFFGFEGASVAIDTGCSSSISAIHLACRSLLSGESSMALAGGVNAVLSPLPTIGAAHAWLMSGSGRCASFDRDADGYVRSEGCGLVALKTLARALADGDRILGVIRGSAVNHDGNSSGLTAPNPAAQAAVIREALRQAGVEADAVTYVEGHGVGTPAADRAEIEALSTIFTGSDGGKECVLGSVKANIGHLETAAGAAALAKVLLCFREESIPAQLHFHSLPEDVDISGTRLRIPVANTPWPRLPGRPRIAGINSFGVGGSNAHLVIEEPPVQGVSEDSAAGEAQALAISAAHPAALRELIDRYIGRLEDCPAQLFAALCRSANSGRSHLKHRVVVVARTPAEAIVKLRAVEGGERPERGFEDVDASLADLCRRYAADEEIEWGSLAPAHPAPRVPLPSYPFQRRRFWMDPETTREVPTSFRALVAAEAAAVLAADSPAVLDHSRNLFDAGLKSLGAIELKNRLQARLGSERALPATVVFEHPTIEALAAHLEGKSEPVARALAALPVSPDEPIAVIGIGCRFPKAAGPNAFWTLLRNGVDAVTEVPPDRWNIDDYYDPDPTVPGKMCSRFGAFLDDVRGFDPHFFGISPREAAGMDPQQRLALQVAWEALEDAGQAAGSLDGTPTGVFIGVLGSEFQQIRIENGDPAQIDAYYGTGCIPSAVAGRVSHALGLRGPALVIDTACSSSLVAIHTAAQSLRSGECDLALAGGVNVILSPQGSVYLTKVKALSPDGRCKTFDQSANGYIRGEGCGIVVLKRLSDAIASQDNVLAVIRGSAVNHDGASGGFTVPSGSSQRALITEALARAGVEPHEVGYIEAHGTGTPLGDPIEARALGEVFSPSRSSDRPLFLASVKTNIGHLEAAAGIAGFIKAVLVLRNGEIPPHLHFNTLNPAISLDGMKARIPDRLTPWRDEKRICGVSSFGISGTNAHIVLEASAHALAPASPAVTRPQFILPLSARGVQALNTLANEWIAFLESLPDTAVPDICHTAARRRNHHSDRIVGVGRSAADLAESLRQRLDSRGARPSKSAASGKRRIVFVFPGQGSQWFAMGRELMAAEPVFRSAMEACDAALRPEMGLSIIDELEAPEACADIAVVQPVLFAMQVSLAALWTSWGIQPDAVAGHSMGEVAAAVVAGALTLEDGARVIARRSRLLRKVKGRGAMAVAELSYEECRNLLRERGHLLSIAACNGPRSTVLSGDTDALEEVLEELRARDVFCRRIQVDVASHSPQVDSLRDDLSGMLTDIHPRACSIPFHSTVAAEWIAGTQLDAGYWVRNLRQTVLFSQTVLALLGEGHDAFIEISPHPVLLPGIEQCIAESGADAAIALATTRKNTPEQAAMLTSLGALYEAGHNLDWALLYPGSRPPVPLPAYPWQNQPVWFTGSASSELRERRNRTFDHPLLGNRVPLAADGRRAIWETEVSLAVLPYLTDHRVNERPVLPGMAYIAIAVSAAEALFGSVACTLRDVEFHGPLMLKDDNAAFVVQTSAERGDPESARISIHSRPRGAREGWVLHMSATIAAGADRPSRPPIEIAGEAVDPAEFYRGLAAIGNRFGPAHQGIVELRRDQRVAFARCVLPSKLETAAARVWMHPALLDACLQPGLALGVEGAFMPTRVDSIRVFGAPGRSVSSCCLAKPSRDHDFAEDAWIMDDHGAVMIEVNGIQGRYLERDTAKALPTAIPDWLYEVVWEPKDPGAGRADARGNWLICCDCRPAGEAIAAALRQGGGLSGVTHVRDSLAALRAIQGMTARDEVPGVRIWLITSGAQPVVPGGAQNVRQSPVWGLGGTLSQEHPALWGGLIDLDAAGSSDSETAGSVAAHILNFDGEDRTAWRNGVRCAARLRRVPRSHRDATGPSFRAGATYLITGGLGGIGLELAFWMVANGARRLILMSRTELPPRGEWNTANPTTTLGRRIAAVRALEARGAAVHLAAVDVADGPALSAFLDRFRREGWPEIRGVMHAAGVVHGKRLTDLTAEDFESDLRPKVDGGFLLDEAFSGAPLDFFVLFSSASAVLSSPFVGAYAGANAFLDALAHERRARGLTALSVNWGFWAEVGLAQERGTTEGRQLAPQGMGSFTPANGLEALRILMEQDRTQAAVMPVNWPRWCEYHPDAMRLPLLADLVSERSHGESDGEASPDLRDTLLAAEIGWKRRSCFEAIVQKEAASVLRHKAADVDVHAPLGHLGLDSLMGLELRNRLERKFGLTLPATLAWTYPTVADLTEFLARELGIALENAEGPIAAAAAAAGAESSLTDLSVEEAAALLSEVMDIVKGGSAK